MEEWVGDVEGERGRGGGCEEESDLGLPIVHGTMELCTCSRSCYQRGSWSGRDALDGAGDGETDAAFPRGKPSSDQRRAAQHLGHGALPRCRHYERTGATRISSYRYEWRSLDHASRGLALALR